MKYAPKPSIKMLPVLAVDRSNIDALFTGIKTIDLSTLGQESFHFVNRSVADSKNPLHFGIGYAFPQILIYTVIKDVDGRVLSYSRAKGTEDRLSKFNSIGFGGHVDVLDLQVDEQGAPDYIKTLQVAASRELYEELNLKIDPVMFETNTLLTDLTDSVGHVHLGLICEVIIDPSDVKPDESEIVGLEWVDVKRLRTLYHSYESWSRMIIHTM